MKIYIKGLNLACTLEMIYQCCWSVAFPGNYCQGNVSDKYYDKSMYFLQTLLPLEPGIGKGQKLTLLMPQIIFSS